MTKQSLFSLLMLNALIVSSAIAMVPPENSKKTKTVVEKSCNNFIKYGIPIIGATATAATLMLYFHHTSNISNALNMMETSKTMAHEALKIAEQSLQIAKDAAK